MNAELVVMKLGALGCLSLTVLYIIFKSIQRIKQAYLSPLAAVPNAGPLAPLSRLLWVFPQEYSGNVTLELPRLHAKFGPLLRIGPKEVSFYSLDVYDAVYKVGSKFVKDPRTYGEFVQGGHPALFSIADPEEHARRRRLMGQLYNRSRMDNLRGLMTHVIGDFIQTLKCHQNRPFDCMPACRALEADIMSLFSFGESIGAVKAWSNGESWDMVVKNDEKATWMPVLTSFPGLVSIWQRLERQLYTKFGWQTTYSAAMSEWESWASHGLSTVLSSAKRTDNDKLPFPNLISTMVRSGLHPQTALSEARENLGPGTDTTSASLAHILWALAHNPQFQNKLRQELSVLGFPTDLKSLDELPKLKASVKEGIRWTGAAAAMLPRIVPAEGVTLEGFFLPGGTTVTSSPIWYLRDANAFPNPLYYNPYRWMTADGTSLSDNQPLRDKYYIPFSKGSNVCIGAHFSYYELYLSLSQILKHYTITLPSQTRFSDGNNGTTLYSITQMEDDTNFQPVRLPDRKEWVAAVPTERLGIVLKEIR